MSARLGEMLLKVGALTEDQLEQVLNAQAIYGGRLGTNLVEMGFIGEDELARALNEKLGVPCVDPALLNDIPKSVLSVIPVELVQRYRVLPVALEGKRLTVAMADPSDFNAIDEIGFVSGCVVVPRVCSELRLTMALEHHFGIKRAVRYIPVSGGSRSRFGSFGRQEAAAPPMMELELGGQFIGEKKVTVQELAEQLAGCGTESDVVTVLLSYLDGEFDRSGFFTVKQDAVVGVKAISSGANLDRFPGVSIPIGDSEQLKRVVEEKFLLMGEAAAQGPDRRVVEALGAVPGAPVVFVPLSVHGKVAAMICASDDKGRLAGGVFELQRIAAMVELTFEMVWLRKRIKST